MRKSLIVLVSGAPGAGKTTLAGKIAEYMMLPHVERDSVIRGIEYTHGGDIDRANAVSTTYYELLGHMASGGVSFVTEGTIYKGISEDDIKSKLLPHAHVINVHARAKNEHQRWYEREMNRETQHPKDWVDGHMATLEKVYESAVNPLDLGVEIIEVDCDDGYNPSIKTVVGMINESYNKNDEKTH